MQMLRRVIWFVVAFEEANTCLCTAHAAAASEKTRDAQEYGVVTVAARVILAAILSSGSGENRKPYRLGLDPAGMTLTGVGCGLQIRRSLAGQ